MTLTDLDDPGPCAPRVPNTPDPPPPTTNGHHQPTATPGQVAPHDLDAERALLGAAIYDLDNGIQLLDQLPADALYHPAHTAIAHAILELTDDGITPDPVTVAARLRQTGDHHHTATVLIDIAASLPTPGAARGYAAIIRDHHRRRHTLALAHELTTAARDGRHATVATLLEAALADIAEQTPQDRYLAGGDWILDAPPGVPAVWGDSDDVLWAEGEALIIAGPPGVGKTTLTGQVVMARLGLHDDVLGHPVTPTSSRVLYLAMDRPRQIQRALARLVQPQHRPTLNDRLIVRPGPPPADLAKQPGALAAMARQTGADTVIIDSLKDAAIGLSDDDVGAAVNRAIQTALAEGVQVLALHHQRKGTNGHKPKTLEDLYGSTWISAGAGSVVLLWGSAGDAVVELIHLKQPAAPVGPLQIEHDAIAGTSSVVAGFELLGYLKVQPRPVSTEDVARASVGRDPTPNETAAIRNRLRRAHQKGLVHRTEEPTPGGGKPTAFWSAITPRPEPHQ